MTGSPGLFDRRVKARSLGYVFTAGALLGLATLALPHDEQVRELPLVLLAAGAIAIGGLVYARADRLAEWELHAALASGTLLIAFANHYVAATALYPILYSWTALYAFYFFGLRAAFAHMALIGLSYAVLLVSEDPPSALVRWTLVVGTPTVAGLLISRLLGRLGAEATRAQEGARALRQSESRTRLFLETAHDAFVSVDASGVITGWNAAAQAMFGWSASEAVGRRLRDLIVPPEGRSEHDERRRALLSSEDAVARSVEMELQRRDGSRFPAEAAISRIAVDDEPMLAAFVRDLSERRRRQQEREALWREQAARQEAERVAHLVARMQLLVDAALAHSTLDEILDDLLPRVRAVLDADAATLFLADEERLVLRGSTGEAREGEPESVVPFGQGFAGTVAADGRPRMANDPPPDAVLDPSLRELPISSLVAVPLVAQGEVTGVIQAARGGGRYFGEDDLTLLRLAAGRVALALDHARVYEREHRIAETLQRSLLPERLPNVPGLAVAARYQPARTEAEVGGDWYDLIPIPGGRVGLVMGDVAGKGLAAASTVGSLRSALRAYALDGHDPGAVIERLNRVVWSELDQSGMATLVYVVLDPDEGALRWVNAGHPPPLLRRDEGRAEFLEDGHSVPLGVLPFPAYAEASVEIEPGATVVLYTDGLVERPGVHIDDGLARLAREVTAAPADPSELCDHLLRAIVPGRAADDVALLALQNTPMADHFAIALPAQPEALASMRALLRRWLRHVEGTDQEIAEITTACGEAATNAIEHAAGGRDAPFEVDGRFDGREVAITVRDQGTWRRPRDGDRGRGLSLMRALMDDVEVTPGAEGTSVRLRRVLDGGGRR